MRRHVSLADRLKNIRRLILRPECVHVIYDKERTAINPRPGSYVYPRIEAILRENAGHIRFLLDEIGPHLAGPEIGRIMDTAPDPRAPFWNNGYFDHLDARVAFALTAARRPRRIIEIGSGNSTKFFRRAVEDFGLETEITSIDPKPRAEIEDVADLTIKKNALDTELELFSSLDSDDILFFDGSHLVFNGTDTTRFFLEILPLIHSGVLVHVHDICLPYEYDDLFTERMYNEQYLLACTLMNTAEWRPLIPVYYLQARGAFAGLPGAEATSTSFWMTRR